MPIFIQFYMVSSKYRTEATDLDQHECVNPVSATPDETKNEPSTVQLQKNKNRLNRLKWKKRRAKRIYSRKQRAALKNTMTQPAVAVELHQQNACEYLRQWSDEHDSWKFKKNIQAWLINHALEDKMLPKHDFRLFCRYARNLTGLGREHLLKQCAQVVERRDLPSDHPSPSALDSQQKLPMDAELYEKLVTHKVALKRAQKLLKRLAEPNCT
ncbi:hypothetical protein EG68_03692 [Paragonimus skrjabini miyazakii]|uniref:WKF domain-containing protein n=1 Tax=Paragonimus skrjabini miyazakii TaxID=59628 RepID=A0A8S9Z7N0_9TREM|nr:hypothetical protein EG68_03692 [Paragonimus skrjabini miyazakii]